MIPSIHQSHDSILSTLLGSIASDPVRRALGEPTTQCELCSAAGARGICRSSSEPGLATYLCCNCGVFFTKRVAAEGRNCRDVYAAYWSNEARQAAGTFVDRCAVERVDHLNRWLPKGVSGSRILEIGAGRGELVRELLARGARVEAIEPDPRMANVLRKQLGIPVFAGVLEDFNPEGGAFDVATLSHVLEHLARPIDALRRIRTWLVPDGALQIEVPNADVLAHGRLESFFFDEPTHLFHFSQGVLTRVASAAGFGLLGIDEVFTNHWGPRTAIRALGTKVEPTVLRALEQSEHDQILRTALRKELRWRVFGRAARKVRHAVGDLLKQILPSDAVSALGRRLDE